MRTGLWWLFVTVTAPGCGLAVESNMEFKNGSFEHERFHYGARGDGNSLLGEEWSLDNWEQSGSSWSQKKTGSYSSTREFDYDNDGNVSVYEKITETRFDLKLVNRRDKSVIWAKAHPVRNADKDLALASFFKGYADSLNGRGVYAQGNVFGLLVPASREFVTFVRDNGDRTVGGVAAYGGIIEIAEAARLQAKPEHRDEVVAVRMVRTKFSASFSDPNRSSISGGLLVLGYTADAENFQSHLADYESFVSKVWIEP